MDFSVPKKVLAEMVDVAKRAAADPKSTVPALTKIHLSAMDGKLTVEGNNLYTAVRVVADATVRVPGAVLVPHDFNEYVNVMPVGEVCVRAALENGMVEFASEVSMRKFVLPALAGVEFPAIMQVVGDKEITFPIATLLHMLKVVKPSVHHDETKPKMANALLRWAWGSVEAISCDGNRYTRILRTIDDVTAGQIMIPRGMLDPLMAALDQGIKNGHKECVARFSNSALALKLGTTEVFSKLTEEEPLPIDGAIPKSWGANIRMHRQAFIDAVKAIEITGEGSVILTVKRDEMKFFAREESVMNGAAADEIQALAIDVPWVASETERSAKVNPAFLKAALDSIDESEVVFCLPVIQAGLPALIAPASEVPGNTPREAKHLIGVMPMQM